MDRLNLLVPGVLKKKGVYDAAVASLILRNANNWIEETIPHVSGHLIAKTLKDGILILQADHTLISAEFQQHKAALIDFLAVEHAGSVQQVMVRIG